jgi:tight adherence protein C
VLSVALGLRWRLTRARAGARLASYAPVLDLTVRPPRSGRSILSRALTPLAPLVSWLAALTERLLPDRQVERARANLAVAGLPASRHLAQFLAAKGGLAIAGALAGWLYQAQLGAPVAMSALYALTLGLLGFYLPGIWLGRRMAWRRLQVVKALPDALDLLSISVSAGLGFDAAMLEVVQRWRNPLTEELAAVLRDMRLGTSRREALRAFAARSGVDDVNNFVAAVIQAEELGSPMKDVLRIQADQMRMRRRHRAEEQARKAVIKMLFPMVFFIFPAMFVVIIGPAVPSLQMIARGSFR